MKKDRPAMEKKKMESFAAMSSSDKSSLPKRVQRLTMLFQSRYSIVFTVLLIIALSLAAFQLYKQYKSSQSAKKTVVKQVIVRRSKIPNVIVRATTAKAIDVSTGKVITAARIFTLSDKTVYLSLDLDKPKLGTFIDYIRYLNGRYVDHGNIKIARDATKNVNFSWTNSRTLGSVQDGKWKIATYTNGILEKRVTYTVKNSQVMNVKEEQISKADPDYYLFASASH